VGSPLFLEVSLTDGLHYHTEVIFMAKYVVSMLFITIIAIFLTSGCYSGKGPLVVIGDTKGNSSSADDDSNTSTKDKDSK
jgi:hypothetical protein